MTQSLQTIQKFIDEVRELEKKALYGIEETSDIHEFMDDDTKNLLVYARTALPKAVQIIDVMRKALVRIGSHEVGMKAPEAIGALKQAARILEEKS